MKMKDQLDSAQPMKKHKAKVKKANLKKKKLAKLEAKQQSKEKKQVKSPTPVKKSEKAPKVTVPEVTVPEVKAPEAQAPETQAPEIKTPEPIAVSTTPSKTTSTTPVPSPVANIEEAPAVRTRVSKSLAPMTKAQQRVAINKITKSLILNEISQGAALRELRVSVLGLRQEAYTELTGVSRKTLSEIENDKGNYTPEIINKVFKPFDLKIGLVPTSSSILKTLLR